MGKKSPKSLLKLECRSQFIEFFRGILYNPKLSWGEKVVGLACLDVKGDRKPSPAKLARKFKVPATSISRFKAGFLKKQKVYIHPKWEKGA